MVRNSATKPLSYPMMLHDFHQLRHRNAKTAIKSLLFKYFPKLGYGPNARRNIGLSLGGGGGGFNYENI
jgi:hypothetical protein